MKIDNSSPFVNPNIHILIFYLKRQFGLIYEIDNNPKAHFIDNLFHEIEINGENVREVI